MPGEPAQRNETATSVRNVGAIASLSSEAAEGPDFAIVDLCLFATTDGGERVTDPRPPSVSLRIERSKLTALELSVQMTLRLRRPPNGVRREAWARIAGELASHGIETDPETLHTLGFALVCDDELQAAREISGR